LDNSGLVKHARGKLRWLSAFPHAFVDAMASHPAVDLHGQSAAPFQMLTREAGQTRSGP
jgi:hypothetical protein